MEPLQNIGTQRFCSSTIWPNSLIRTTEQAARYLNRSGHWRQKNLTYEKSEHEFSRYDILWITLYTRMCSTGNIILFVTQQIKNPIL